MLTPSATDPNREAELVRKAQEPCSFGLLSMDFSRLPGYFKDKKGITERPKPSQLILPEGVKR